MSGSQNLTLNAKGIHTNNNYYGVPQGSLSDAVNVVIDRTDIVEPRRGFDQYGGVDASPTKQLLSYKDTVIKHYGTKLAYDNDDLGTFIEFHGDDVNEAETGVRLKYVEMNGNLYFTTAAGIKKVSALTKADFYNLNITRAGAIKAVDMTAVVDYNTFGFLEPNSKAAYKAVIGTKDINSNLLLGVPSARSVVWNVGTTSATTTVSTVLPSGVDTNYFVQFYRTGLSTETDPNIEPADPGEEMYLVIELPITATDITNGYITTPDITSEDFRRNGALLYVNPVSGEGILQANEPPPFCKDMTEYKGYMFYVNTATVQRLNLAFITILGIISGTSTFKTLNGVSTTTYTYHGTYETEFFNYNAVAAATSFYNAAPGPAKYFTLISASDERKYLVWFKKNATNDLAPVLAGYINIEVDITSGSLTTSDQFMDAATTAIDAFTTDFNLTLNQGTNILTAECSNNGRVTVAPTTTIALGVPSKDGAGSGDEFSANAIFLPRTTGLNAPDVGTALEQVSKSLVKKINAHDPIVNAYYISSSNDIPGQIYLENRNQTGVAFWVNSNTGTATFNPAVPATGSTVISTNEIRHNRAFYSKFQQPEAVPLVNYIDIGPKDRSIKRVLGLRDSLFFFKEDAIYRLSGDSPSNFTLSPFDSSVQILAPDTAVILNNQIYAMSTQGVVVITDTGVSIISRPIENQILGITRSNTSYKTASFGVPYESDRSYLLWTVKSSNDTVATQCFRYNTFTNTWTKATGIKTCGMVNFADNKLYMGAGDFNFIEKERKNLTRSDHCDRSHIKQLVNVNPNSLQLGDVTNITEGDLLQQTQYVTCQQFNRLLRKLNQDAGVQAALFGFDFVTAFELQPGQNPYNNLCALGQMISSILTSTGPDNGWPFENDPSYWYFNQVVSATVEKQTVLEVGFVSLLKDGYVYIVGDTSTVPSLNGRHKIVDRIDTTHIRIDFEVVDNSVPLPLDCVAQIDFNYLGDNQSRFNDLVTRLNSSVIATDSNYLPSEGSINLEQTITTVDSSTTTVATTVSQPFFQGEVTIYKAIDTFIIYNPQFFQDPSVEKQVRQFSAIYEDTNFSKILVGFTTDKSQTESQVPITKAGVGDFGQFGWGTLNFGGVAPPTPLLTYVPLDKQRCRQMQVALRHKVAQENYSLLGVALTFRPYGIKVTK